MDPLPWIEPMLRGGLASLGAYLAAHVLLCLIPAFFIAGALAALVPKESITPYLGCNAPKRVAYPAAALAGSMLAVCSCTIVPLFAGIHRKGAGIGPAITFLFFAPAGNILAIAYTGAAIGNDFALARIALSLVFGIGIGLIMATIFHRDDLARAQAPDDGFAGSAQINRTTWYLLAMLLGLLVFGTLKVALLLDAWVSLSLPFSGADRIERLLFDLAPYDPSKGEEGLTLHGAVLVALLVAIAPLAWKGFGSVDGGLNRWTWVALGLIALTLLAAAVRVVPGTDNVSIELPGKFFGVAGTLAAIALLAGTRLTGDELQQWLWEAWRFVRQIFPILVVGVFVVGMARAIVRPEWIEAVAGANTVTANVAGVAFGIVMYFPTLVEVPVAKMFLSLGMHPGPLMAYLMADPELSLQSILMTIAIIGRAKTFTYVALVAVFSTLAGLAFGAWVDGTSAWLLGGFVATFVALIAIALQALNSRGLHHA
jgi:uncharacterized membrane protein YraQ (UPF0718 family)